MSEEAVRMPWKETETNFSAIEVDVTVFPNNRCREFYGDEFVGDKMLCAGHEEGGVDACQVRIVFHKQFLTKNIDKNENLQHAYILSRAIPAAR